MYIRELTPEDYDTVLLLWKEAGFYIGASDTEAEYVRFLGHNPQTSLGLVYEGKLIASVLGGFDGRRGIIHHLVVAESFQKMGFGKFLLNELVERFRRMKVVKLSLWVKTDNSKVTAFYEKMGFELREDLDTMSFTI